MFYFLRGAGEGVRVSGLGFRVTPVWGFGV